MTSKNIIWEGVDMNDKIFEPNLLDMVDQVLDKCKTCPVSKRIEMLHEKNMMLSGKYKELLYLADKLFFDMKLEAISPSDYKNMLLNNVIELSRSKIEEILNNDGKVEDIRNIIVDLELLTGR